MKPRARQQRGALLLAVLVMLALIAAGTSSMLLENSYQQQRDAEAELLDVGEQYRQAIQSYLQATPNGIRVWPSKLEDLVADNRYPMPRRHLRKLFRDPMSPGKAWVPIMLGPSLIGVRSQATGVPFRKTGFTTLQAGFANAKTYADWEFTVTNTRVPTAPTNGPAPTPPTPPAKSPAAKLFH